MIDHAGRGLYGNTQYVIHKVGCRLAREGDLLLLLLLLLCLLPAQATRGSVGNTLCRALA